MRSSVTSGVICMDGPHGAVYSVCAITYTVWENGSFEYDFTPNYAVIDLLDPPDFQGIPGLDLSLRRSRYVRKDRVPVFVEERTPAPNREGLWEILENEGMDHLNRLEWLIRSDMRYVGDSLYVVRAEEADVPQVVEESILVAGSQNVDEAMRELLKALARGDDLVLRDGSRPAKDTRKALHDTLVILLDKGRDYRAKRRGAQGARPSGRRRIVVEDTSLDEALSDMEYGKITADEAAKRLGISRATLFRRKREWGRSQ